MELEQLGRAILLMGLSLLVLGLLLIVIGRSSIAFGRLPGDIRIEGNNFTCFAPITSMILISVILTIVLNIVARLLNR